MLVVEVVVHRPLEQPVHAALGTHQHQLVIFQDDDVDGSDRFVLRPVKNPQRLVVLLFFDGNVPFIRLEQLFEPGLVLPNEYSASI